MISCLSTWSLNKQLPFPRFPLSPFPGLSVNSGRPPWIAELLQWQSEGIVHKFPGSQWLDISSVLPAAHAGMGCRSPGNLNKMQIKAGMEGCSLRVHSSVVVKLRCRDGWGSAPRVPHICIPPGQHGTPWHLCFRHTHLPMPPVSNPQSTFCLMNPCLSPPAAGGPP